MFIFCNKNLRYVNVSNKDIEKLNNPLAEFIMLMANIFPKTDIEQLCFELGVEVSIPKAVKCNGFEMIKQSSQYTNVDERIWKLVRSCISLRQEHRPTIFVIHKELKHILSSLA